MTTPNPHDHKVAENERIAADCVGSDREWSIKQVKSALDAKDAKLAELQAKLDKAEKTILALNEEITDIWKDQAGSSL